MNGIIQRQHTAPQQIAGVIRDFRRLSTRTGKPMAIFMLGTLPAKCFDFVVDAAEHWAATAKRVLITGHLSAREGTIELVAQGINLAPGGQADTQTGIAEAAHSDMRQGQRPIRERGTIAENLSGSISNMKMVTTRSGRAMITFKLGNSSCKAFGELASAIKKAEGKQIEVSARKGSFQGVTEYAIETVKAISGAAVDLSDTRTRPPGESISKTPPASEAINASEKTNSDSLDVFCGSIPVSESNSAAGTGIVSERQPPVDAAHESAGDGQIGLSATIEKGPAPPHSNEKHESGLSAAGVEALVQQYIPTYRKTEFFSDKALEKFAKSGSRFGAEAARRVLEERARQKAEVNRYSEDYLVQVGAASTP